MTTLQAILLVIGLMVTLPVVAYMVMKFGTAGYFRAKQRQQEKNNKQL